MMNNYDAVMIAEGVIEVDEDTQIEAWQHLVDTGLAWSLQGWFGRTAMDLIEQGVITKKETNESKRNRRL
jgi:hypothetical protein